MVAKVQPSSHRKCDGYLALEVVGKFARMALKMSLQYVASLQNCKDVYLRQRIASVTEIIIYYV